MGVLSSSVKSLARFLFLMSVENVSLFGVELWNLFLSDDMMMILLLLFDIVCVFGLFMYLWMCDEFFES